MRIQAIQSGGAVRPHLSPPRRELHGMETVQAPEQPTPVRSTPAINEGMHDGGVLKPFETERLTNVADIRKVFSGQPVRPPNNEVRTELLQNVSDLGNRFAELADTLLPESLKTNEMGQGFGEIVHKFEESALTARNGEELQAAFDTLYASALMLFTATKPEGAQPASTGNGTREEKPIYPPEIPSPLSQFMSELASTFSNTMSELAEVLANEPDFPTGEPRREGTAYDALAIEYDRSSSRLAATRPDRLDVQV